MTLQIIFLDIKAIVYFCLSVRPLKRYEGNVKIILPLRIQCIIYLVRWTFSYSTNVYIYSYKSRNFCCFFFLIVLLLNTFHCLFIYFTYGVKICEFCYPNIFDLNLLERLRGWPLVL